MFKHSAQSLNATKLCCKRNEVSKQIQIVEEKSTHLFGAAKAVGKNGRLRRGSGNSGKPSTGPKLKYENFQTTIGGR